MADFAATAERLRVVKDAFVEFVELWAIEQLMEESSTHEKIWQDVCEAAPSPRRIITTDSSFLYQSRRLDD